MKPHDGARLGLALFVGDLLLVEGVADESQHGPIGAGGGLDDMRHKALLGLLVVVGQILAAAGVFRLAVIVSLDHQLVALANELALHVRAQVEVAAVRDALEFAVLALLTKRKRVLDVSCAHGVVREFCLLVVAENQSLLADAEVDVPLESAVAPKLIPLT